MRPDLPRRLCVPAFLAVTSVGGAPGCGDDEEPPTTTAATTDTTAATTAAATTDAATTGAATTGPPTTGAETTADTGGLPICDVYTDQMTCNAQDGCAWYSGTGTCIVDCAVITDPETCNVQDFCAWIDGQCVIAVL